LLSLYTLIIHAPGEGLAQRKSGACPKNCFARIFWKKGRRRAGGEKGKELVLLDTGEGYIRESKRQGRYTV